MCEFPQIVFIAAVTIVTTQEYSDHPICDFYVTSDHPMHSYLALISTDLIDNLYRGTAY